jgi:cytochrome P450
MRSFPFPEGPDERAPAEYTELVKRPGLAKVLLSNGSAARLVCRHAEVKAVLSDDRFSRGSFTGRPMFAREPESLALAAIDPPLHSRRRRAVLGAFTARRARELTPWLRTLAEKLLDELVTLPQPVDLVDRFTVPFTLRVISDMLGVPQEDEPVLRPLVDRMMSTTRFPGEEVARAHAEAARYFDDLVAERASRPAPDLLSELLTAPAPDRLSRKEIAVFGAGLLMAGYETTSNQLAMCTRVVFGDPPLAGRLRRSPTALGRAVEEMLRCSALIATGGAPHVATEDVRLGDTVVRAGDVVVPLHDAANQDPAVFEAPERFVPDRADNPHLAFGHGRHFCLGAHLARVELNVGLSALLKRFDSLTMPAEPHWRRGMFIRGPVALPVRWTQPATRAA